MKPFTIGTKERVLVAPPEVQRIIDSGEKHTLKVTWDNGYAEWFIDEQVVWEGWQDFVEP